MSNSLQRTPSLCAFFTEETFGDNTQASKVFNFYYQVVAMNKDTQVQKDTHY